MVEFITKDPQIMFAPNGDLKVILTAPRNCAKQFDNLPNDKELAVEIKRRTKKRSIDANAYFWVLCDKVAEKIRSTKEEVYCIKIKEYGVFEDIAIEEDKADAMIKMWGNLGLGWFCERFLNCKIDKCAKIRRYYGSSIYDSKQMWRLINGIVDDCHELGIETMTPAEIERLCASYNVK